MGSKTFLTRWRLRRTARVNSVNENVQVCDKVNARCRNCSLKHSGTYHEPISHFVTGKGDTFLLRYVHQLCK